MGIILSGLPSISIIILAQTKKKKKVTSGETHFHFSYF